MSQRTVEVLLAAAASAALLAAGCAPDVENSRREASPASGRLALEESASAMGISHHLSVRPPSECMFSVGDERVENRRDHAVCTEERTLVGGVAGGDLNGDGYPELLFTRPNAHPILYLNLEGERFEDVSAQWGLDSIRVSTSGAAFGDLDGDGDLDLVLGTVGAERNLILRNDRGEYATWEETGIDVASSAPTSSASVLIDDFDGDGSQDVLITRWYLPERWSQIPSAGVQTDSMMLNRAGGVEGRFEAIPLPRGRLDLRGDSLHRSFALPESTLPVADFSASFTDLDGDGMRELILAGDWGTSRVLRLQGSGEHMSLSEKETEYDLTAAYAAMGLAVGDVDGDGTSDLFVTAIKRSGRQCGGRPCLSSLHNQPDGNMLLVDGANLAFEAGVEDGGWGWGAGIGDLDGDGAPELLMTNGWDPHGGQLPDVPVPFAADRDRIWRKQQTGWEEAGQSGFGSSDEGRALLLVDLDLDGRLDVVVTRARRGPDVYMNRSGSAGGMTVAVGENIREVRAVVDGAVVDRWQQGEGSFFLANLHGQVTLPGAGGGVDAEIQYSR